MKEEIMCGSNERRTLKEQFEKMVDDVDNLMDKQKALEEYLKITYVEKETNKRYKRKNKFTK